jgi:hypothetical protein
MRKIVKHLSLGSRAPGGDWRPLSLSVGSAAVTWLLLFICCSSLTDMTCKHVRTYCHIFTL